MITFERVGKVYANDVEAVHELSMEVAEGETLILLGTSGCGKTTTLKMVNRLIEPTSGRILIDGTDVMRQNPIELRRGIGYAIQNIGLFPHMTVSENVAVVPKLLQWPQERIGRRVEELLATVGLEPEDFRDRYPAQLSGGQRQRVGVARALAADPPIVLMDEPFGALDPITRDQLQTEFMDLEDRLRKTVLFVTHDIFESVKLGDRIALLDAGQLQQLGTPAEIVESPANDFVDQFLGEHRFQLSLLTRTVRQLVEPGEEPPGEQRGPRALVSHSIIEALDAFKRTPRDRVPAYDEHGAYKGDIRRARVLEAIADAVGGGSNGVGAEA